MVERITCGPSRSLLVLAAPRLTSRVPAQPGPPGPGGGFAGRQRGGGSVKSPGTRGARASGAGSCPYPPQSCPPIPRGDAGLVRASLTEVTVTSAQSWPWGACARPFPASAGWRGVKRSSHCTPASGLLPGPSRTQPSSQRTSPCSLPVPAFEFL